MTYRELLEFTKKNPNPFWSKEQHEVEAGHRYRMWLEEENARYLEESRKKEPERGR